MRCLHESRVHHIPFFSDSLLAQMFAREVFSLLLSVELISQALVEKIMGWHHSGFSVHSQVIIHYFGLYANAHRGKIRKEGQEDHKLLNYLFPQKERSG